jgi:hypothetical protein
MAKTINIDLTIPTINVKLPKLPKRVTNAATKVKDKTNNARRSLAFSMLPKADKVKLDSED